MRLTVFAARRYTPERGLCRGAVTGCPSVRRARVLCGNGQTYPETLFTLW